jgi:carbamoyltransferase
MVYILGYKTFHDSSAALMKDGDIIGAVEEERFNRIKHTGVFPVYSIKYLLDKENIKLDNIDHIVVPWIDSKYVDFVKNTKPFEKDKYDSTINFLKKQSLERKKYFGNKKINEISHHLSHAASSFFPSGFKKANILVMDASGETEATSIFKGLNDDIQKVWSDDASFSSFGRVYARISRLIFVENANKEIVEKNLINSHPFGKTMGLSSYGKPSVNFSDIINYNGSYKSTIANYDIVWKRFKNFVRKKGEKLKQKHKNLAASLQSSLENTVSKITEEIYDNTGIENFCLSGGVALNCKMNGMLLQKNFIKDIFIQPAANDAGSSLGAVLEFYNSLGYKNKFKMKDTYLGPEYSNDEIKNFLKKSSLKHEYYGDISGISAELLNKNKIIGWFQQRMEFGPRALGNRSILANPSQVKMSYNVNKIKHREFWRPLAPSILEEKAKDYFENNYSSPFMLLSFKVKEEKIKEIPAVVHIDKTTRPHTVSKEINPRFYNLIKSFEEISSIPMILNTSFNDKDEPIVCNPTDALNNFKKTKLDYLAIGNYLVRKNG